MATEAPRFKRLALIAGWDAAALRAARIAIVGCGTTGTEVAKDLALCGVGALRVIDPDIVEPHNASALFDAVPAGRVAKVDATAIALRRFAPDTAVEPLRARLEALGEGVFADCAVVILGLDNLPTRAAASDRARLVGVPCIDVGVDGLSCRVQTITPDSACFRCGLWPGDLDFAGRVSCTGRVRVEDPAPQPISILGAALGAALAAEEAIEIVLGGVGAARFAGRELRWSARNGSWTDRALPRRADCDEHGPVRQVVRLTGPASRTGAELGTAAAQRLGRSVGALTSLRPVITCVRCSVCAWSDRTALAEGCDRSICPDCGAETYVETRTCSVSPELDLGTAGFPAWSAFIAGCPDGAEALVVGAG